MVSGVLCYGPSYFEDVNLFNYDNRPDFNDRFGISILGTDYDPEHKSALYKEMATFNYLTKNSPTLLLVQGDGYTANPVKHACHMEERAKKVKAPFEIMIIKNAGHNWREVTPGIPIAPGLDAIIEKTTNFFLSFL